MRIFTGTVLAAILLGSPAHATEPTAESGMAAGQFENRFSAVVELNFGFNHYYAYGSDSDGWTVGGLGSVAVPIGQTLVFQADIENSFIKYDDDTIWRDVTGTAHLFARDPERGAIGIVAAASHLYPNYFTSNWEAAAVGIEGHGYFNRVTATGQIAYAHYDFVGNPTDSVIANVGFRYFPTDNFMISGKLGVVGNDPTLNNDWTLLQGQARAEYRFSGTPFGIGANYLYSSWDSDNREQVFGVFARLHFGNKSLFENDRTGPSMDPLTDPLTWN